jgi:hypothetical protein
MGEGMDRSSRQNQGSQTVIVAENCSRCRKKVDRSILTVFQPRAGVVTTRAQEHAGKKVCPLCKKALESLHD